MLHRYRKPLQWRETIWVPGGGGGSLMFSSYIGLDPASSVNQNKSGISGIPKKYLNFNKPQKYLHSVHYHQENALKCTEMTPKTSQVLWWPHKNIHRIFIPKTYLFCWKSSKNIQTQDCDPHPPKAVQAYVCVKNIKVPPPPPRIWACWTKF